MASDGRGGSGKVSTATGSAGVSGIRRSGRETKSSSKDKVVAASPSTTKKAGSSCLGNQKTKTTPSSTRRSGRLEKQTPETNLEESKSKGAVESGRSLSPTAEKRIMSNLSPIRSEKLKSRFNPESDLSSLKRRKVKSLNQLTEEASEDNSGHGQVSQDGRVVRNMMDARAYKKLWTPQTKKKLFVRDQFQVLKSSEKLSKEDDNTNTTSVSKELDKGLECSESKEQGPECSEGKKMGPTRQCVDVVDNSSPIVKTSTEEALRESGNIELPPVSPKHMRDAHETEAREDTHDAMSSESQSPNGGRPKNISNAMEVVFIERSATDTLQPREQLKLMSEKNIIKNNDDLERIAENTSLGFNKSSLDLELATSAVNAPTVGQVGHNVDTDPRSCSACSKRRRFTRNSAEDVCCCTVKSGQNLVDSFCQKERMEPEIGKASEYTNEGGSCREAQEPPLDVLRVDACNTCFICKLGGDILCCEGKECKRSYHLHCLDPPLTEFPFGIWYCIECVWKKITFGVHVVSKGIESIWDARELDDMENKETQKQKQYYVKYKGLAHVHNRWIPESELLHEASSFVSEFKQMSQKYIVQTTKWRPEWSVPQRLLLKRQLMSPKQLYKYCGGKDSEFLDCQYEWLVKWCGLDYDQVTWELENSEFLTMPEAQWLKIAFENRQKTNNDSPEVKRKGSFVKLSELPTGIPPESANNHLDLINKLREFWHKGQNAVLVEDSERMLKVILFIVSMESSISHPVLIIASSDELLRWEREFLLLAPSLNVVVYSGTKDVRRRIRTLEAFNEQFKITFQVLITTEEVMTEDLEVLVHLGWDLIIVDECQRSNAWVHFGDIKRLTTEMRILLVSWKLKETAAEYCNLLSLLDCCGGSINKEGLKTTSNDDIVSLKNKVSRYVVQECKSDSLKLIEYWVPAQASNVQLEQYCAALLSNGLSLCSSSKKDTVEALYEIIIRNRKCCDHPYIVDPSVQEKMLKGLPVTKYLDVGIKASGKLQVLDSMLSEIKNRGLRVVILFQSIVGFGKDAISIGDILDDYMRQRFGPDSYERIDVLLPKKQAALDKFNNKESGRFVLLLEARAAGPSIKLASIDAVIIYGSDWIPTHDFRNLQKIPFKLQYDQIKVFRLYTSYTLEEKLLVHVKQSSPLDSIHNMFRNTNHKMLMWGAIYLFKRLEDFHGSNEQFRDTSIPSQNSLLRDVLKEFSIILDGCNSSGKCFTISTVKHNGRRYSADNLLVGEAEIGLSGEVLPNMYWTRLLEGKNPRWKYVSGSTQRNRKRVHHMDDPAKKLDVEIAEVSKKRKKVVKDQGYVKFQQNISKKCYRNREGRGHNNNVQRSFHHILQSEVFKLCKALRFSDEVKGMVNMFLTYVMTKHHVPDDPTTITQAYQIALCWTAASLLKQKINHKASLAHAKEHFSYECTEEEAERVYSKMRCLKSIFLFHCGYLKVADSSTLGNKNVAENIAEDLSLPFLCEQRMSKVEVWPVDKNLSGKQSFSQQQWESVVKMVEIDVSKSVKKIGKKCSKQMSKLLRNHEEERKKLLAICEEDRELLEKSRKLDAAVVRFSNETNVALREDSLKSLDDEYKKRFEEHENQKELRLRYLDEIQFAAREKEKQKANSWVVEVSSWAHVDILDKLSPEDFHKLASACDVANQTRPDLIEFVEDVNEYPTIPETDTPGHVVCQVSTPSAVSGKLCRKLSRGASAIITEHISEQAQVSAAVMVSKFPENLVATDLPLNELNPEKSIKSATRQAPDGIMPKPSTLCPLEDNVISNIPCSVKEHCGSGFPVISCSSDDTVDLPVNRPTFEIVDPPVTSSDIADRRCLARLATEVGPSDCIDNAVAVSLPRTVASSGSGECATSSIPDVVVLLEMPEVASNADARVNYHAGADYVRTRSIGACTSNVNQVTLRERTDCTNIQDQCCQVYEVETPVPSTLCRMPMENGQNFPIQVAEQQSHPCDGDYSDMTHDAHVTTAAGLTTTFPSSSDSAFINEFPNQEPVAEPIALMQMQNTSIPVHLVASQQFTREFPVSGPPTSISESQSQQNNEVHRSSQVDQDLMQLFDNIEIHPSHNSTSEMARIPISISPGPLQNELERICKEIYSNNQLQQEKKLQLESDCEKEIAEVLAQIRQKYKVKSQDIDAEYGTKSTELERYHDMVLMNKILAEAFKSKCMDMRSPSALGLDQDRNSHFRQQLPLHPSSQQTTQRPSSVTIQSAGHPTSSSGSTAVSHLYHTAPPAVSPIAPLVLGFNHSSATYLSIPPRPAEASHLSPPTNTQLGSEIRSMPPHLQRNRSSVPMSTTRIPLHLRASSNLPSPNTLSMPVLLQHPSYIETRACPTVPYSRPQQSKIARALPGTPKSSTAVPPDSQPVVNSPTILPESVHMGSDLAVQSKTSSHNRMQDTLACTAEANIVCLSDDE